VASVSERRSGPVTRTSGFLFRHRGMRLGLTLGAPMAWFIVIYIGSLAVMFVSAFWTKDAFSGVVIRSWSFANFETLLDSPVYRTITIRTIRLAAAVTVADILVAVVIPLWANYLVRVFAWKLILTPNGFLNWLVSPLGITLNLANSEWAIWLTFVYLWLPFTLLPIYGALERVPESYLEASGDLGAKGWLTFRRVVFPLIVPGIVAGSIFSFSLTLGDYIVPSLVGNTKFIGNVIYDSFGIADNVPFAAAFALVPVAIMAVYLLLAKRAGAFEAL
jgi:putative spermidine/putrescine transport system permease protein